MKNVVIGVKRNAGEMVSENTKSVIKFDNMMLYLADFDDFEAVGFTLKPFDKGGKANKNLTVKIRSNEFREVVGMTPEKFLATFKEKFMFRKVKLSGVINDYGEVEVEEIRFSKKDCFQLREEELAEELAAKEAERLAAKEAEKKLYADDDEFDDTLDELEEGGLDEFEFVDEDTGEVKVTKRSGAGESD